MKPNCPSCHSNTIKKNGHIHNGKQNYYCLVCTRQFVLNPKNKIIDQRTREEVQQALLERVSLEGICRIFSISMPWLLRFMEEIIAELPEHLNARLLTKNEEFEVTVFELDEQWSFVQNKTNKQWLWLVFHLKTRQILAMHIGKRTRESGEILLKKLPEDLKKKPSFIQINSLYTMRSFLGDSIDLLEKNPEKQVTLRDLITPCDKDAQGL